MSSVTFILDQNNQLVAIDTTTGFPSTIPLTVDGLKMVQKILSANDQKLVEEYNKHREAELKTKLFRQRIERQQLEKKQLAELEELF